MPTDTKTLSYPCPRCGLQDEAQVTVVYDPGRTDLGVLPAWRVVQLFNYCHCWLYDSECEALYLRAEQDAERLYHPSGAPKAGPFHASEFSGGWEK